MIESKAYSFLEHDTWDTLLKNISSIKFLDKLITIKQLLFDGVFHTKNFSTISSDIDTALDNIGRQYPQEVIDKLSLYKDNENNDMKRFANLFIDKFTEYQDKNLPQPFTIEDVKSLVFN